MANNDEKYLDGPGLTDILQKQKVFNDDFEYRIKTNEMQLSDKTTLTGPELKQICQSGRSNLFQIGDVIDVGNAIAICVEKNVPMDLDGSDRYELSDMDSYMENIIGKGDVYSAAFIMFPKTHIAVDKNTYSIPTTLERNLPLLNDLYSGMNEIKDAIDETILYSDYSYQNKTNGCGAIKDKSKLHIPREYSSNDPLINKRKFCFTSYGGTWQYDHRGSAHMDNVLSNATIYRLLADLGYMSSSNQPRNNQLYVGRNWYISVGTYYSQYGWTINERVSAGSGTSIMLPHYEPASTGASAGTYLVPIFFIGKQS